MKVYWGVEVQLYSIRKLLDTASCNVTVEVKPHAFLPSAFDVGEWSASRPGRFTSGTHPLGRGLDGSHIRSERVGEEKRIPSLPLLEIEHQTYSP